MISNYFRIIDDSHLPTLTEHLQETLTAVDGEEPQTILKY